MANEGWGDKRPSETISHYYKSGRSLCGKVGLYRGDLTPDAELTPDANEDCARCRTKLDLIGSPTPPASGKALYKPKPPKAKRPSRRARKQADK